jgi:RNA polymerase sigma-32 factor
MSTSTTQRRSKRLSKPNRTWERLELAAHSEGMLSRSEETHLARLARQGDQRAFDRLVHAHIPLVLAIAHEYRAYGLPADEVLSEGLLGLVKATREFDPEHGTRLATYAAWWIRARIRSYTITNRRIVRAPATRNARKLIAHLRSTERRLQRELGVPPDADVIASALGVRPGDVEEMRSILSTRDAVCVGDTGSNAVQFASKEPSPEVAAIEADDQRRLAKQLRDALSGLDARSRDVIERRHLRVEPAALADIGDELGISRERVRQIEAGAKKKVREAIATSPF